MDDDCDPLPITIVPPKIHSSDKSLKWGRFHLVRALPFQKELERGSAKHEAFLPSFSSALACLRAGLPDVSVVRAHLAHYFPRQTSNIAPASFPPIPTSKIQTSRRQTLADESRWQPLQVPPIYKHLTESQPSNVMPKISSLTSMYLSIRDVSVC